MSSSTPFQGFFSRDPKLYKYLFTFTQSVNTYNFRGHKMRLHTPKFSGSSARENFYSNRNLSTQNKLPDNIINSPNLFIFKSRLQHFDLTSIYTTRLDTKKNPMLYICCLFIDLTLFFVFMLFCWKCRLYISFMLLPLYLLSNEFFLHIQSQRTCKLFFFSSYQLLFKKWKD